MENEDNSHRKNLASKFEVDEVAFRKFSDNLIYFLNYEFYEGGKRMEILFDSEPPRFVLSKASIIRDYFKTTGENGSEYKGKLKNGYLALNFLQFENYVSRKKIN